MKSSKMLKKADALKGFLGSMSKKKGEMGMGMTPPSKKITSLQSKSLGVAKGTPYKTTSMPSDKINTVRSSFNSPPRNSAEVNAYMQSKRKPSMKKGGSFPDLNKDGQITKADILMGRGVIGKKKAQNGMEDLPVQNKVKTKTVVKDPNKMYRTVEIQKEGPKGSKYVDRTRRTVKGMLLGAPKVEMRKKVEMRDVEPSPYLTKNSKKKAQMGMNVMSETMSNATPSIPNSYYKMGGMKEQNPLASMIKKKPMKKSGMKPKMQMGGAFFPQNPLTASKYQKDTLMGQSFKKGGMVKKKKK